ncbi:hypothetical protein BGX27_003931, partial [Mortierella sp. AM989]
MAEMCIKPIRKSKARDHYENVQSDIAAAGSSSDNTLRGNVPADMLEPTMKNMNAKAYQVDAYPMLLPPETAEYLQSILPNGHNISELSPWNDNEISAQDKDTIDEKFLEKHEEYSENDLLELEANGLDTLMGAVIITGPDKFRITCAEFYLRDVINDPHAESQIIFPSSVPTEEPSTQYSGELKVTHIPDNYRNQKFVIGVRTGNYHFISGFHNGIAILGPGRCSAFAAND